MQAWTTAKQEEERWRAGGRGHVGERKEGGPAERSTGRRLSFVMDVWIGLAFIVAMAACAGVEYVRNPDVALDELLLHHLLELFLFGFVLWGISWIVLRVVLVAPIQQIFRHLYGVGGGDHSPLVVNTGVKEIREMVDAINIMLWRMERQAARKAPAHAREQIADIGKHLAGFKGMDHAEMVTLIDHVTELEMKL